MSGSADPVTAIVDGLAEKARLHEDVVKVKVAFPGLTDDAALMLLYGLRANGIKSVDEWLSQQPLPQTGSRKAAVQRLIADGFHPPTTIRWKAFCNLVRDECNGWIGRGPRRMPAWGFDSRTIKRDVQGVKVV
jgi:hypothetical protein